MKKIIKLFLSAVVITIMTSSCEKACICRNIDNGSSDILYGVYTKKDCEAYTEYYKTVYNVEIKNLSRVKIYEQGRSKSQDFRVRQDY